MAAPHRRPEQQPSGWLWRRRGGTNAKEEQEDRGEDTMTEQTSSGRGDHHRSFLGHRRRIRTPPLQDQSAHERRGRRAKQRRANRQLLCTHFNALHCIAACEPLSLLSAVALIRLLGLLLSSRLSLLSHPAHPPSSAELIGSHSQVRSDIKLWLASRTKQRQRDDRARPCSHPPSVCWLSLRRCCCCCCH